MLRLRLVLLPLILLALGACAAPPAPADTV